MAGFHVTKHGVDCWQPNTRTTEFQTNGGHEVRYNNALEETQPQIVISNGKQVVTAWVPSIYNL